MKDQLTDAQRKLVEETLALLGGYGPPEHAIAVAILRGVKPTAIKAAWDAWVAKFNGDQFAAQTYNHNDYANYLYGALLGQRVVEPNSQPTNFGTLTCNENEIMSRLLHPTHPTDILGQPVDVAQRNAYKAFLLALTLRGSANLVDQARAAWIFTPAAPSMARSVPGFWPDTWGAFMRLLGSTNPAAGLSGFTPMGQYLYLTGALHPWYGFTFTSDGTITGMQLLSHPQQLDQNYIVTLPDGREVPKPLYVYAREVCMNAVRQNPGTKFTDDSGIEIG